MDKIFSDIKNKVVLDIENLETLKDIIILEKQLFYNKDSVFKSLFNIFKDKNFNGDKKEFGNNANTLMLECKDILKKKRDKISEIETNKKLQEEEIDIELLSSNTNSLSGFKNISQDIIDRIVNIFTAKGFVVASSPEVEDDFHNFEGLNFEENHPAREMQDTFYIDAQDNSGKNLILRTHTSNTQIRVLKQFKNHSFKDGEHIGVVSYGKCFRNEDVSSRSHVFFNQIEVFLVGKNINIDDMMAMINTLVFELFGSKIETKFRHSYFPFVQPGLEVDISCIICSGKGCRTCKNTGWLEILGAGMIHDNVLKNTIGKVDDIYGYALGLGIERVAMLLNKIDDIRELHSGRYSILNNSISSFE